MNKDAEKGLSATQLALVFLAGVAVCAVFFALGFIVARNQRPPIVAAETERVPPPAPAPAPLSAAPTGSLSSEGSSPSPGQPPASPASSGSSDASTGTQAAGEESPSEHALKSESLPAAPVSGSAAPAAPQTSAAPPAPSPSAAAPAPTPGGGIVVQVAAAGVRADAERLVDLLKSRGYPAFLVTPEAAGLGDNLFRVQVGPYKLRAEALGVRDKLVADGFKPFVRK
jgi:cell division septation protein DedD